MKVLLLGGGTGGHLYPLLNVAKKLKEKKRFVRFLYIGPVNKHSKRVLEDNGIKTKGIFCAKWRRYFSIMNFIELLVFPLGLIQSLYYVLVFMPDVVFSKGGYGSVSPMIAARLYWIPILIHESDTVPGKVNKLMGKIADKVAIFFEGTKDYFKENKVFLSGNPVRMDINDGDINRAREVFELNSQKPVILVLGGSQGSMFINEKIVNVLPQLMERYEVIHQIGDNNFKPLKEYAEKRNIDLNHPDYHPYEYIGNEIIHAYSISSLVISRAGATTIAELAAMGKPSILIPLSSGANSHQIENAYYIARTGGAIVMEETNFKGDLMLHKIKEVVSSKYLWQNMSNAVRKLHYPEASNRIAEALLYLAKEV